MHWFLASLIAPFIWSIVNHADKLLLSRYFHGGSGGLMLFVGIVSIPFAALLWVYDPTVVDVDGIVAATLIASGILYNVAVYAYLKALEREDASYVVPFWQLTPVCAYFFGVIFLGEYIATDKILGGVVVLAGAFFLSTSTYRKRLRFDVRTMVLMTGSSATLALGYVLFKDVDGELFLRAFFWNQIGMVLFSTIFFLVPQFRAEFYRVLRENTRAVIGLNVAEQILEIAGVAAANFAVLLAPAAMVVLVEYSSQPLFVFLFGVLFTILFPNFIKEDVSRSTLIKKCIAIAIMTLGLLFVVR